MQSRPATAPLLDLWQQLELRPDDLATELEHRLLDNDQALSDRLPLLAWPLIEARRRSPQGINAAILQRLGAMLDIWELRYGLCGRAEGLTSVAAQTWLVQDLHCLADLQNHFGNGNGGAWSNRGHLAETALHAALWTGISYGDRTSEGQLVLPAAADQAMPLLLLDTPAERVALLAPIARAALDTPHCPPDHTLLLREGLRRHGLNP